MKLKRLFRIKSYYSAILFEHQGTLFWSNQPELQLSSGSELQDSKRLQLWCFRSKNIFTGKKKMSSVEYSIPKISSVNKKSASDCFPTMIFIITTPRALAEWVEETTSRIPPKGIGPISCWWRNIATTFDCLSVLGGRDIGKKPENVSRVFLDSTRGWGSKLAKFPIAVFVQFYLEVLLFHSLRDFIL